MGATGPLARTKLLRTTTPALMGLLETGEGGREGRGEKGEKEVGEGEGEGEEGKGRGGKRAQRRWGL